MAADRRAHRALIRRITAEEVRAVRHRVLRPGRPFDTTVFGADHLDGTVHLGAFDGEELVGVASLAPEPREGMAGGWRLRGMATLPEVRGRGFGSALLDACLGYAAASGGGEVWCNARLVAVGFYQRAGFEIVSEEFDIAGIGPHVVMARSAGAARTGAGSAS